MSDVWRDIKIDENNTPDHVIERLADLFAIDPYTQLDYYDFSKEEGLFIDKRVMTISSSPSCESLQSQLINNDCIESLRSLPESSVDFIFADPPYNLKKKYENWDDDIKVEEYFSWCDEWIKEIHRVLKPGKVFCLINIPLGLARHYMYAQGLFKFMDYIVWEGLGLPVRNIMPAHYGLLCMSKGNPDAIANYDHQFNWDTIRYSSQSLKEWYCIRQSCVKSRNRLSVTDREPITNLWWDIHRLKHNSKRVDHPCQLPPDLIRRLIYTFTNSGDIVLDPFNGAGTTTLIADMMNRKYVGIELSQKYHKIARQRHLEIANGIDPFRKNDNIPKSKNSRVQRMKKQQYKISKKTLQLEVKQIAQIIGRKPTKEDVKEHSKYPFKYFEEYFIDWGEVCAAVGDKGMNEYLNDEEASECEQLTLFDLDCYSTTRIHQNVDKS